MRRSQLFANTSSSSKRRIEVKGRLKDGLAVRAYILALNDEVLRANLIKALQAKEETLCQGT